MFLMSLSNIYYPFCKLNYLSNTKPHSKKSSDVMWLTLKGAERERERDRAQGENKIVTHFHS